MPRSCAPLPSAMPARYDAGNDARAAAHVDARGLGVPSGFAPRQIVRAGMAALLPRRWFLVRGRRNSQNVCLTFDDGPHPQQTPRVLDLLAKQHARATFFIIGQRAEEHPDLVKRILAEGHELGHHTFFHRKPELVAASALMSEVHRTSALIEQITGRRTRLFRPPNGKLTTSKLLHLWRAGQSVVLWNVDAKDYASRLPQDIADWFRARPLRGGDIVLMHDDMPHAAVVLPQLLSDTRTGGLNFVTVSEEIVQSGSVR